MQLRALLDASMVVPARLSGKASISSITQDSRTVTPGALFVAMPRTVNPSESFLAAARANGATAAFVHTAEGFSEAERLGLAALMIPDEERRFHEALWRLCDAFYEHPTRQMRVIGVTGTNGKTTVAWMMRDMLRALGIRAAYLGTLGFQWLEESRPLANTTPFVVDLYRMLAEARDAGVEALAMEVSSHALAERRSDGVEFDAAVFTNLTQDHLDYHGTMEAYAEAKRRLFTELPRQTQKRFVAALNVDDPVGREWADSDDFKWWPESWLEWKLTLPEQRDVDDPTRVFELPFGEGTAFSRSNVKVDLRQIFFTLHTAGGDYPVSAPLGGGYNVENLHAALAGLCATGLEPEHVAKAASQIRPVPGRFEPVQNDSGIDVIVDYAHTPDALRKLLENVRPLTSGRIITVFGCGGDRDRTKRPLMASAAEQGSDHVILTSDNPRTEDPGQILDDAAAGLRVPAAADIVIDRPGAVRRAINLAAPGDVVVIAGKGHENYQIIGSEKISMDDRDLARAALASKLRSPVAGVDHSMTSNNPRLAGNRDNGADIS